MTVRDNTPLTNVQYVKGVGPKKGAALREIGIETIADLLYYFPRRYLDRSKLMPISKLTVGSEVTVIGQVRTHGLLRAAKKYYEVLISDETGTLPLIWFGGIKYIENRFKTGMTISVSGKVTDFRGVQLVHPEFEIIFDNEQEAKLHTGRIIPLYPSTAELKKIWLHSRGFRRIIKPAVDEYADRLSEILPQVIITELGLLNLPDAVRQMHYPDSFAILEEAQKSLSLRELIQFQLIVADRRRRVAGRKKPQKIGLPDKSFIAIKNHLPFTLTNAQNKVIVEIFKDLFAPHPMQRLLQGDVGSGKTVVAALTMAIVARSGYQSALMAPTEILAQQHCRTISQILEGSGLVVGLLTRSTPTGERTSILQGLQGGDIDLLIGTHAIISEGVRFNNLAYVIVDEQHRFGVSQREQLLAKGKLPDLLVMTATPIPRTLALTAYGDLDLSTIDEMPAGRRPVKTALRTDIDRPKIYKFVKEEVAKSNQVFIIYPLVQESVKIQLKAATKAYEELETDLFPDLKVGLVHGQMKREQRDQMMAQFADGKIDIMAATTVVEVGIDMPDATVIIIEHAERFGLSQLHQLRGRVGRSDKKSYCILLTEMEESSDSYQRLEKFVACSDGFEISELDLQQRGPGDLLGLRQSGIPLFKVADLTRDWKLVLTAREYADKLVAGDYRLTTAERDKLNQYILQQRAQENVGGVS